MYNTAEKNLYRRTEITKKDGQISRLTRDDIAGKEVICRTLHLKQKRSGNVMA